MDEKQTELTRRIGEQIRQARSQRGWTTRDLAARVWRVIQPHLAHRARQQHDDRSPRGPVSGAGSHPRRVDGDDASLVERQALAERLQEATSKDAALAQRLLASLPSMGRTLRALLNNVLVLARGRDDVESAGQGPRASAEGAHHAPKRRRPSGREPVKSRRNISLEAERDAARGGGVWWPVVGIGAHHGSPRANPSLTEPRRGSVSCTTNTALPAH